MRTANGLNAATPHMRVPLAGATRRNQRWSMDFVSDRLGDGRWFRNSDGSRSIHPRVRLCAYADRSQTGTQVVAQMKRLAAVRGVPESITTDSGQRVCGPGNVSLGSCNGSEVEVLSGPAGAGAERMHDGSFNRPPARRMLEWGGLLQAGRMHGKRSNDGAMITIAHRPHSALGDRTPQEFAAVTGARPSPSRW